MKQMILLVCLMTILGCASTSVDAGGKGEGTAGAEKPAGSAAAASSAMILVAGKGGDGDDAAARQVLAGIDRAIQAAPTRRFVQHYSMKFMHGDDTSRSVFHVTLQRDINLANSFGFRIRGYTQYEGGKPFHVWFDGEEALMGNPDDSLMTRIPPAEDPARSIRGTFADGARFPYIAGIGAFTKLADRENVVGLAMHDSTWSGEPAWVLEIIEEKPPDQLEEENSIARRYLRVIVRAHDTIPMRITEDMDITDPGGMVRQHRDSWIEQLELNPDLAEGYFSRGALPEYVLLKDYSSEDREESKPLQPGTTAPDFLLPVYKGDSLRLSDLRGKVVFIDFWYKSCHPCRLAAPKIEEMYEEYGKDGRVVFLGINPYDKADDRHLQSFIDSRNIAYPILLHANEVAKAYEVQGYPTFFIIDREGIIHWSDAGYGEGREKMFREELEKLLNR